MVKIAVFMSALFLAAIVIVASGVALYSAMLDTTYQMDQAWTSIARRPLFMAGKQTRTRTSAGGLLTH